MHTYYIREQGKGEERYTYTTYVVDAYFIHSEGGLK